MAKHFQVDTGGTLTTNLVSYYKLEDANDFYASNNLTNTSTTFSSGKVNNAATFNGSTSKLVLSSVLSANTTSISMGGWIYLPDASVSAIFLQNGNHSAGTNGIFFGINNNDGGFTSGNTIFFLYAGVVWRHFGAAGTGWVHLMATIAADKTLTVYKNNVAVGSTYTDTMTTPTNNFSIGYGLDPNGPTSYYADNGVQVDEVFFHEKVISSTERGDLYNSGDGQTMIESSIKSFNGLAYSSIKSINGLVVGSIKSINGLT